MSALTDPRALANLLLVEIGNSHVTLATSRDGRFNPLRRIDNDPHSRPADESAGLAAQLDEAWIGLPSQRLRAAIVASVVPERTQQIRELLSERHGTELAVVGDDIPVPIHTTISNPRSVGIDRLCAAAAAYEDVQAACAVASFGTATTIDCVDDEGNFRGGAILPGLALQAWALHEGTAQLPQVPIAAPTEVYGGDTRAAITNGIVYGTAGALREIVERYATDLNKWPRLVVTGGFGKLMRDTCEFVDALMPDLVLRGMVLAYRKYYASDAEDE